MVVSEGTFHFVNFLRLMSQSWSILTHPKQLLLLLTAGTAGIVLASAMVAKKGKKGSPKSEVSSATSKKSNEQKTVEVCEKTSENSNPVSNLCEIKCDQIVNEPIEKPFETPVDIPIEKPVEISVEIRTEIPVEIPAEVQVEVPAEKPFEKLVEIPADKPVKINETKCEKEEHEQSWTEIMDEEKPPACDVNENKTSNIADALNDLTLNEPASQPTTDTVTVRRGSGMGSPDESETVLLSETDKTIRVTSPSGSSEDSLKHHKIRTDSGCSYGTSDDAHGVKKSKMTTSDSGNGSTEADDGNVYTYHFSIPRVLCGKFIGVRGCVIKELKAATNCNLIVNNRPHQNSNSRIDKNSDHNESQTCFIEGTRSCIERCLVLIREKFPLEQYPDLTLDQVNRPNPNDNNSRSPEPGTYLPLTAGQLTNVYVSAIMSGGHICIQQPEHPTFEALARLELCMFQVYEQLQDRSPNVNKEIIDAGLICVAKFENQYFRLQIVSYDDTEECCEVKFLDYGGYGTFYVTDLKQIRTDFLTLPFQAVECYLSNVIPPNGSEWPFESAIHLEQLTNNQANSCRVIGMAEDLVPIVQLYTTTFNYDTNAHETRLVNKELVERGGALWVEHSVTA